MTPTLSFTTLPIFCVTGNKVVPDSTTLSIGYQPQQQLPCEHYNYIENAETTNLITLESGLNNTVAEMATVLTAASLSPSAGSTSQVKAALDALYMAKLPIGTILMFDASNNWTDNVTLVGWYACIADNTGLGCPNLVDKFILGKVVAGAGSTGGSNTHTIAAAELPTHTHDVVLGSHAHALSEDTKIVLLNSAGSGGNYASQGGGIPLWPAPAVQATDLGTKTTNNGGFTNTPIDTHPSYYSVVYIRRVS